MRAFFEAAVAAGAEVLHEPRLWPEYHPNYYGAFVRDPDGNNVEAVCHSAGVARTFRSLRSGGEMPGSALFARFPRRDVEG